MVEETPDALLPLLASLTGRQLSKLAAEAADSKHVAEGRKQSILNVLLLLGIEIFNGRSPLHSLPLSVQADIRAFFESYKEACRRADRLLFKLRDDAYLRNVMQNSVGKMTPTAIYVHRRAAEHMPVLLKLYEHCGAVAVGRPTNWDLIKLAHEGRSVSWLGYPDFDRDPHPRLAWSYNVDMRRLEGSYRSYVDSDNRPLLHRKHEFLDSDDSDAAKYRRLTEQEVRAGLYLQPHLIGNERGWETALQAAGVRLVGHRLVPDRQSDRFKVPQRASDLEAYRASSLRRPVSRRAHGPSQCSLARVRSLSSPLNGQSLQGSDRCQASRYRANSRPSSHTFDAEADSQARFRSVAPTMFDCDVPAWERRQGRCCPACSVDGSATRALPSASLSG